MPHVDELEEHKLFEAEKEQHLRELLRVRENELTRSLEEIQWLRGKVGALEQKRIAGPGVSRRWWWPW
jgi:hypothetical protein